MGFWELSYHYIYYKGDAPTALNGILEGINANIQLAKKEPEAIEIWRILSI